MTEIRPFKAVRYNSEKIKNISKVVCPPYDVISKEQQDAYHKNSEYNFIRILLGKDKPSDNQQDNKYQRARLDYEKWLKEGVFCQDENPSIYFCKQEYKILGERHSRLGFISLMRIEDDGGSRIFPHENTHSAAKEDRLKLWSTVSSNLSPIFVCFSDTGRKVDKIFNKNVVTQEPLYEVKDEDGIKHTLWRLDAPELIKEIADSLNEQQLFIADGHHRYEVSKELRKLYTAKKGKADRNASYNFVMTYFTNMDSKDLKIFPMHRIIGTFPKDISFLDELFRIDRIKRKEDLVVFLAKAGQNEHAFGLYTKEGLRLLRLKHKQLIDKHVTEGSSEYKRLDATILKYFVLDRVHVKSEDIIYTKDTSEVYSMVDEGQAHAGFIMNPVKIKQLKAIALNGERMPPKTTYFYPKILSGLTIHKIE